MRPRQRVGFVVASLAVTALLFTPASGPSFVPGQAGSQTDAASTSLATGAQIGQPSPEPPAGALRRSEAIRELRGEGANAPALALNPGGTVGAVTAAPGQSLGSNADGFVKRYAAALGMTKDHTVTGTDTTSFGSNAAHRYQQQSAGLPVLGGQVVVMTGEGGAVQSAIAQTSSLRPTGAAKISPETARATGLAAAKAKYGLADGEISGTEAKLWLLDPALIGLPGKPELRPAYWVKVHGGEAEEELASVLVDAIDGSVRLAASEQRTAANRIVCDLANRAVNLSSRAQYSCVNGSPLAVQPTTRYEGGPSSSVADVNSAYYYLGIAYDFYKNNFGRDSYDGHGGQIRATVRACDPRYACPYQNAFYSVKGQFVFGQGWAVDDVAAHEYTHAVTDYASSLYYWQQSGAINEALSDIFGELIDLSNPDDGTDDTTKRWLVSENSPIGVLRNMADPNSKYNPAYLGQIPYWDNDYDLSDNGGVHTNSGVANKAAFLIADGGSINGISVTGIGLAKSAQLWYRVMHMLPSGANYYQLGQTLGAVCRTLIGHFGFTAADCTEGVDKAVAATWMQLAAYGSDPSQPRVPVCNGDLTTWNNAAWPEDTGEPSVDLFYDGMEKPTTNWVSTNSFYWQQIPNPSISYTYAAHGRGSLNGWTYSGETGNGAYIEMAQPVALPVGKASFLHFANSLDMSLENGYGREIDALIQVDGGGWQLISTAATGSPMGNGRLNTQTLGFGTTKVDLSVYAGHTVRFRFQIVSPQNLHTDWYLDDFRIGYCDNLTGAPAEGYGYPTPSGLSLNWAAPKFVSKAAGGGPMSYQWELSYSPSIPGAPTTVPQGTTSLLLAGADPNQTYRITIHTRMADGRAGADREVLVTAGPPVVCPTTKPASYQLSPIGNRPLPGLPAGACTRPIIPRRN